MGAEVACVEQPISSHQHPRFNFLHLRNFYSRACRSTSCLIFSLTRHQERDNYIFLSIHSQHHHISFFLFFCSITSAYANCIRTLSTLIFPFTKHILSTSSDTYTYVSTITRSRTTGGRNQKKITRRRIHIQASWL
jgi:hypothetical protein